MAEIVLTGVDVTSWGADLAGTPRLGDLVGSILGAFPELARLRLSSLDGAEIDPLLEDLIASEARVMPHLVISGEIVVCGSQGGGTNPRITSREEAQTRYAEATQGRAPVQLPELGIFRGPATVSGVCIPGIFNCPKPPALFVDVRALPQAPPGSDADRIARGLPPQGQDVAKPGMPNAQQREELGLPPPPAAAEPQRAPAPSPEESAAPAAPR